MTDEDHSGTEDETLRARLSGLVAAILRISEDLDLGVVLQEVVDGARSLTDARYGAITTLDDAGNVQDLLISGMTPEQEQEVFSYPQGHAIFEYLSSLREPLRTGDFVAHLASAGLPGFWPQIGAFMGAPIRVRDRQLGTLYIGEAEAGREFTREDEETLEMFANQAAMAITNARRYGDEQRAKADLEALVDTSPVGVAVFDAHTRHLVAVNYEARRIFGISRQHEHDPTALLRELRFRRIDGTEIAPNDLAVVRAAHTGEFVRADQVIVERPDGERITTLVNATPIRSEDGEITSVVVTVQDITPLEELERLRAEFLGMVSHELRAPLASIKGSAATARNASFALDPAETRQFFRIIEEQADHMRDLISNLLDLTRIEAGTLSVAPEATGIGSVVEQAKNAFISSGHDTSIEVNLMPGLPPVWVDRQRLVQVLYNLFANASKFSRNWSTISVDATVHQLHVAVSVTDEGIGIAPERLPLLFTKFSRTDSAANDGHHNSYGLGLAICKGIVEAHGGRIWADSAGPGRGARFTFTIPTVDEAAISASTSSQPLPVSSSRAVEGFERILVIDDDPHMLRYIRNVLLEGRYTPILTGDPNEVPELLAAEMPHLVLLDLVLPGTDGFELMQQISSTTDAPIIFVSGRSDDQHLARAFERGAADYVVKPFSPTELLTRISAALRRRAQTRQAEPYRLGDLTVDYLSHRVTVAGRPASLTPTEYRLLFELCANSGRALSYDELLHRVWGAGAVDGHQRVRTFVKDLRNKLGDDARNPSYIFTVPGVGYRAGASSVR